MLEKTIAGMGHGFEQSEVEFFLDMAINECQRWLEVTCREIFIDNDDFLYSLRHGYHLRKIINKIIPDCFDLSPERFKRAPRKTRKVLQNAGVRQTLMEKYIEDEDWVSQLLLICWHRFHIPQHRLFHLGDLLKLENFNDPYKSFIVQSCEVGELAATGKWETNNNAQIRRLCSTIAYLADECSRVDRLIPKLDASAVEPLLDYNDWLNNRRSTISFSSLTNPLDFPALDIVSCLSLIVEQVCLTEEQRNRSETFSASSDEGFDTMVECNYAVSKYLADASSEYSTEDLSSYSTGTKSSRSCSPYIGERCFSGVEQQIPTRPQVKLTSQVAHNPLQFVSAKTSAVALCEQAKQQIIMSEEQKRARAEALKAMRSSPNVDEEPAWQRNLDSWLSKRKSAISKSRKVDTPKLSLKNVTKMSETKLTMAAVEANSKNNDEYIMKEKDEILGVRDSPIADEHTDSGIENSKISPYRHSPSTSSELSPQGEWIRSRDYDVDPTDTRNYVMQASWQIQHTPERSPTSTIEQPFEGLQQRLPRRDPRTTQINTLLQIDDNQHQTFENKVDKQALIDPPARNLSGSKAEVDISRHASRDAAIVPSRAVKGTVSELAAKFECSQTVEPKHNVEKVFPITRKERTSNHIQTVKDDALGSHETSLETIKASEDVSQNNERDAIDQLSFSVRLGVELCREQTANVTAVKFPTRQQKCATMRSFKEFPEASLKENDDAANPCEASSSYIPYTTANLAAIKERASFGQSLNTTPPAAVKKEPPEPPARPRDPPSKNLEDASRRMQSVMCTVDIPFEDVPGAAYQPNNTDQHGGILPDADGVMVVNIDLGHHTKNPRKYFGFTVAGGKDKDAALRVESVIAGTPADECGLQVGDLILSVNGETVDDRYHQSVIRMLHEAARLGEVELKIKRASYFAGRAEAMLSPSRVSIEKRQMSESISFDEKRSMFDKKNEEKDSYNEFCQRKKQQHNPSKWINTRGFSTKHNNNNNAEKNATIVHQLANKFDAITNCVKYGLTNERFTQNGACSRSISPYYDEDGNEMESNRERCSTFSSSTDSAIFESSFQLGSSSLSSSRSSPRSNADYRVISLHDKPEPGKLSDFIPEVERETTAQAQHTDNCSREYRHRESEHEREHVVSSLSEVDDARPKLVRNYDIAPLRSDPVSPVQQKIVDFTKRAEEMTYIPLTKKPPPVPQKPSPPPPPPSSSLPQEEEEDHDDDTQPGRSFVRKQLRQQIGLSQQDDARLNKHQTMRSTHQNASEADVNNVQKLPTIDGIRNLVSADSVNALSYENEIQSRSTGHFSPLTSCSWADSATSTLSGHADSNEPTPTESRSSSSRAQQPLATTYADGDKRVTFGQSETHEITPRQTQEIIFPIAQPGSPQETYQNDSNDKDIPPYQTIARYGFGTGEHGECPIERIHPIQLSGQPDPERRMTFSRADQEEKNTATVGYPNEKRVRHPERIAINPKLVSSHFIKVRCRSCNDLFDNDVPRDQRNLNDANNLKKPSSPTTSRNIDRSTHNPNLYQSVTERFYNSDVRTKCYVSRSLSPQSAAITVNCETYSGPMMQDPCRSPELLEATDSREWRQIIEQQRLPNAGDTIGKNRIDGDSKFRIVHSSAGSLKESLLNSSSWSSARSLRSAEIGDVSRLNNTGMSAVESLKPKNTTSVLRTSVEVLHRFPDQMHCQSVETERPSEVLSSDAGREQCCSNGKSSEPVVAVSGKHRCSHCQMELGRGAAMIIESLNLFYHLGCFRCYVCNRSLGNGTQGADVRVRQSKLHCQTCYSNDEAGLKFSQV